MGRGRPLLLLVVVALLSFSCDPDEDAAPRSPAPRPAPSAQVAEGGTVRLGVLGEPPTLDPFGARATYPTWAVARPLYRSLFRVGPDGAVVPDLAASLEPVPGGVRVALRPATWSTGQPITARDVARSARRARVPSGFAGLRVRRRGRDALVFRGAAGDWERRLARLTFVVPRRGTARFSGPFVLAARTPGLGFVLRPNDAWDGPRPHLDRIEVQYVASLTTMIELLDRGRLEAAWLPSSVNLGQRLDERGIAYSSSLGSESVYLDLSDAGLSLRERAWVAKRLDLEHLHEGLIRADGRIAERSEPAARPREPGGPLRLTVPAGDELLVLLAQNLQIQLGPRDPIVEIAVAAPEAVYGGGEGDPGGTKLLRGFGPTPPGALRMFEVASFVAFGPAVAGVEANPTLEGPLWNAQSWARTRG